MTFYEKSEDWLHQSALLLEAHPQTTRVTTRYHIKPARRPTKAEKTSSNDTSTQTQPPAQTSVQTTTEKPPRGHLILKTYDPTSGVVLKYKTSKAAEVGRLVQMLGTLGRRMAALPDKEEVSGAGPAVVEMEGVEGGSGSGAQTPVPTATAATGGQQGGGGKGKKKKGKR